MRNRTIAIIKNYNLAYVRVARMAGVSREIVYSYIHSRNPQRPHIYDWWIEEAVGKWYEKLLKNRRRLLKNTQYAHIY